MSRDEMSGAARVRQVFGGLYERDSSGKSWLGPLIRLGSRAEEAALPEEPGALLQPPAFQHTVPPPLDYVEHLVRNPRKLKWPRDADGQPRQYRSSVHQRRKALMQGSVPAREEAIRGIRLQQQKGPDLDLKAWWLLEGPATVDCALFAEGLTLFVEGRAQEKTLKVHVNWYERRIQLYRLLDALRAMPDRPEHYYLMVLLEEGSPLQAEARAIQRDFQFARSSWPHLDDEGARELWGHFLGFATWQQLAEPFPGSPPADA